MVGGQVGLDLNRYKTRKLIGTVRFRLIFVFEEKSSEWKFLIVFASKGEFFNLSLKNEALGKLGGASLDFWVQWIFNLLLRAAYYELFYHGCLVCTGHLEVTDIASFLLRY